MNISKIYEAIEVGINNALSEAIVSNHRGRPTTSSKLSNLYPPIDKNDKQEERMIRAWINSLISRSRKTYYIDNLQSADELRRLFITAIYKFMEKNKSLDFDWEAGNERYSMIYNLNDLASFCDDIRKNYKILCKNHNFPAQYIKLDTPIKQKQRRRRGELNIEQQQIVNEYLSEFGQGTPYDELSEETLNELKQYTLEKDGLVYVVCRPIRDDSDSNAPAIVYQLKSKYNVELSNAIRLTYTYQCAYQYGCYVNYMYVSSIHLDKYMRDLEWHKENIRRMPKFEQ